MKTVNDLKALIMPDKEGCGVSYERLNIRGTEEDNVNSDLQTADEGG